MINVFEEGRVVVERVDFDELDHHIIDCKLWTTLVKELECFPVDPQDLSKSLQVGQDMPTKVKEKFKRFLDVFRLEAWWHGWHRPKKLVAIT